MDDSCRRAGAIPFKWEICPGTPKHTRSASAAAAVAPAPAWAKVAPKLALPPYMASPSASPSPYYHSPRLASVRSASVSPSRRRYGGGAHRPRPTAFLDLAPRAADYGAAAAAAAREADDEKPPPAAAYRCFPLPMLRRKGSGKKGGGYGSSSSSSGSFRSDGEPGGLRRTASSSTSSSSFSLPCGGNRRIAEAREEVEAAPGWFF